jgi:hypothetical protein
MLSWLTCCLLSASGNEITKLLQDACEGMNHRINIKVSAQTDRQQHTCKPSFSYLLVDLLFMQLAETDLSFYFFQLSGVVEIDGTYIGGSASNKNNRGAVRSMKQGLLVTQQRRKVHASASRSAREAAGGKDNRRLFIASTGPAENQKDSERSFPFSFLKLIAAKLSA